MASNSPNKRRGVAVEVFSGLVDLSCPLQPREAPSRASSLFHRKTASSCHLENRIFPLSITHLLVFGSLRRHQSTDLTSTLSIDQLQRPRRPCLDPIRPHSRVSVSSDMMHNDRVIVEGSFALCSGSADLFQSARPRGKRSQYTTWKDSWQKVFATRLSELSVPPAIASATC